MKLGIFLFFTSSSRANCILKGPNAYKIDLSIIHESQKLEAMRLPISGRIDTQHVVCTYHGIMYVPEKDRNSDTGYHTGEP